MQMKNFELEDIEAALRRGGAVDVDTQAEAATISAIAAADRQGLIDVAVSTVDSPVGDLLVAVTPRGLVRLAFDPAHVLDDLAERISPRVVEAPARLDPVRRELDEYFAGRRHRFELPLDWSLTDGFTRRVLRATARIGYGELSSYQRVAQKAGSPRAVRAAGNALGANPIPVVVPCHRVLRSGGALGGYTGGVERKEFLLRLEGVLA
jgi:methylated-DNA-[protein]-cysteine S-methyltransferase